MPMLPIAVALDTTDIPGIPGSLVAPQAPFFSVTPTVLAGGRPVLTNGAVVTTHGNPYNPDAPGFNPPCAASTIVYRTIPNVLVQGLPVAVVGEGVGSAAACGHFVLGPGVPTVLIGGAGAAEDTSLDF
jgi:uncharacterized Zn-binding protein involved in type VI secretion